MIDTTTTSPQSDPGMSGEPATSPLIRLRQVNKHFGALHVLKNIDLDVMPGEVVVILGPSGSGKSTLCRTINRLEPIDSGDISIDGKTLPEEGKDLAKLRSDIGMVFQSFNLFANKSVLENVTLGPIKVRRMKKADAENKAMALLERVGVSDQAEKHPGQLSGGQQQRVAIARSLAMKPKLMLFDEVTSALDPELVAEVEQVMLQLAAQDMPMLIVTHDMWFARRVASRLIFCADGRVIEDGPPEQVLGSPRTERARDFVDRVFHVGG